MNEIRFQDNIAKVYDTAPRRGMARILNTLIGVYRVLPSRVHEIGVHDDAWISYKGKYVGCYRWVDTCPVFYFEGEFDKLYFYQFTVEDDTHIYPRLIPFFDRHRSRCSINLHDEAIVPGIYNFLVELGRKRTRLGALMRQSHLSCTRSGPDNEPDSFTLLVPPEGDVIMLANYINRHCAIEKPKLKPVRITRSRKPKTTV